MFLGMMSGKIFLLTLIFGLLTGGGLMMTDQRKMQIIGAGLCMGAIASAVLGMIVFEILR